MNWLDQVLSGNLPGIFGIILFVWAGLTLARRQALPGILLVGGAALVLLSRTFVTLIAPKMEYIRVMHLSRAEIALMDTAPVVGMTLGSLLVVFGFLLLNLRAKALRQDLVRVRVKK